MELKFIGRGAAFNAEEGNTNAYFVENETLFLLDCGEGMFAHLKTHNILNKIKEVYVYISHTHSDHCGSLGTLGLYCQFVLKNKLKIVVPHDEVYVESLRMLMTIFGNTDNAYECIYEETLDYKFNTFDTIRYDFTKHDFMLTSYSFVIETKQGAIFYSADTRIVDNVLHFINTHSDIDKIYMEVTDVNNNMDIHLYVDRFIEAIPIHVKDKIWMMHLRGESCKQKVLEEGLKIVGIER